MIINGKYTNAVVYGNIIDDTAVSQIHELCDHPAFEGASVRIMPDCHAGKGCVIGFTSVSEKRAVIPNVVGVDIGCGIMATVFATDKEIDYRALDNYIRESVPSSVNIRSEVHPAIEADKQFVSRLSEICGMIKESDNFEHHLLSIGTLGSGNHFIEIDRISETEYMLLVHTGSRGFGKKICNYYQTRAGVYDDDLRRSIMKKHRSAATQEEHEAIDLEAAAIPVVSRELAFITDEQYEEYVECLLFARKYAIWDRTLITFSIIDFFIDNNYKLKVNDSFDTVHNYIDWYDDSHTSLVIRKGAVSAAAGKKLVIPLNMKDGVIIATGKGNEEWNCSAPHGAGRILSRSEARKNISLEEYKEVMAGVNTWSVCEETIDEAPQAYKPAEEILGAIGDTVDIIAVAKPVYNFKAS